MKEFLLMLAIAITIAMGSFVLGWEAGRGGGETPTMCTQESHYLTTPFDGGTAHDGRTTYTGDCHGLYE